MCSTSFFWLVKHKYWNFITKHCRNPKAFYFISKQCVRTIYTVRQRQFGVATHFRCTWVLSCVVITLLDILEQLCTIQFFAFLDRSISSHLHRWLSAIDAWWNGDGPRITYQNVTGTSRQLILHKRFRPILMLLELVILVFLPNKINL